MKKLEKGDSWYIHKRFIEDDLYADTKTFDRLWKLHPEEHGKVKIMGREIDVPRWQKSFGQSYYFTGLEHKAVKLEDPYLRKLLKWVQKDSGKKYKQVLINWYEGGNHYIGPHSDDETHLVKNSSIYSFSFGEERDFVIKAKEGDERIVVPLKDNSLIIMGGEMQRYYKHSVPKRKKSKGNRINITFRLFTKQTLPQKIEKGKPK